MTAHVTMTGTNTYNGPAFTGKSVSGRHSTSVM